RKLQFRYKLFEYQPYIHTSMNEENSFTQSFETAKKFISQYIEEVKEENDCHQQHSNADQTTLKNSSPKIEWQGTQKELGELFIELKSKGWIAEINSDSIQNYFSNGNTIK